jgi:hypothetical protein
MLLRYPSKMRDRERGLHSVCSLYRRSIILRMHRKVNPVSRPNNSNSRKRRHVAFKGTTARVVERVVIRATASFSRRDLTVLRESRH